MRISLKSFFLLGLGIAFLFASCAKDDDCMVDDSGGNSGSGNDYWELAGIDSIVDAEYDVNNDLIIAVTTNPDEVIIIEPVGQTLSSISLSLDPTCVSVSPDGNTAVVGHDGWISVVDLQSMQVTNTITAGTDVFDVVLAPNGWAYAFPKSGQWTQIFCIELATGNVTAGTGNIREGTHAKLWPGNLKIYGADNGVSPSDVEAHDIAGGPSSLLYDSPYHGDYPMGGDLWFSETGDRIFTKALTVLQTSSQQSLDMVYAATLNADGELITLDHSTEADRVYCVSALPWWQAPTGANTDSLIWMYSGQFLNPLGTITLPGFYYNAEWKQYKGAFGYFEADGSDYHLLMKVWNGSGTTWSLLSIEVQ